MVSRGHGREELSEIENRHDKKRTRRQSERENIEIAESYCQRERERSREGRFDRERGVNQEGGRFREKERAGECSREKGRERDIDILEGRGERHRDPTREDFSDADISFKRREDERREESNRAKEDERRRGYGDVEKKRRTESNKVRRDRSASPRSPDSSRGKFRTGGNDEGRKQEKKKIILGPIIDGGPRWEEFEDKKIEGGTARNGETERTNGGDKERDAAERSGKGGEVGRKGVVRGGDAKKSDKGKRSEMSVNEKERKGIGNEENPTVAAMSKFASELEEKARHAELEEEAARGRERGEPGADFGYSGKLADETNRVRGIALLFTEPPEARKPSVRWRLYVFKGGEALKEPLYIHRQTCYLFGRERKIADIPTDHPSCSKQHAVIQFRKTSKAELFGEEDEGTVDGAGRASRMSVKPYLMDLGSTNGTFLNGDRIEPQRYYELLEKDTIKFGNSSREFVLLHENSV